MEEETLLDASAVPILHYGLADDIRVVAGRVIDLRHPENIGHLLQILGIAGVEPVGLYVFRRLDLLDVRRLVLNQPR